MNDFLKCACPHCGQSIEYPVEGTGQTVPCPTCQKPFVLTPAHPPASSGSIVKSPTPVEGESKARKSAIKKLSALTAETIRVKSSAGNTPLHLAAKNGHIDLIPSHLLSEELFMDRNRDGNTPLHSAAMHGTLYQVPRRFLTKETLTFTTTTYYAPNGFHITGSGYKALCPNVLHIAATSGYVDQIPKDFFTPEFLQIETTGYKNTLLEYLVKSKRLDLLPENYANNELWNVKDSDGHTPLQHLEYLIQLEAENVTIRAQCAANVALVRSGPPTVKQIEKLRWFGNNTDEITTKGQASDALDKCVNDNPVKDSAYYNRPPTEEQLKEIRKLNEESVHIDGEPAYDLQELTYGEAKNIIFTRRKEAEKQEMEKYFNPPSKAQLAWLKKSGIKLDSSAKVTEGELEDIIDLEKMPPREVDLSLFKQHGVISFKGDGFGAYLFADLIRNLGGSAQDHNRANINYGPACQAALRDPDYHKPTLTRDWNFLVFTWPKRKIKEWLRT
jgi:ankyrin repeat protein